MQKREVKKLSLHRETLLTLQHQDRMHATPQAVTGSRTITIVLMAGTQCPCDSTVQIC